MMVPGGPVTTSRPGLARCTLDPLAPLRVQPLVPALAGDFLALCDRATYLKAGFKPLRAGAHGRVIVRATL